MPTNGLDKSRDGSAARSDKSSPARAIRRGSSLRRLNSGPTQELSLPSAERGRDLALLTLGRRRAPARDRPLGPDPNVVKVSTGRFQAHACSTFPRNIHVSPSVQKTRRRDVWCSPPRRARVAEKRREGDPEDDADDGGHRISETEILSNEPLDVWLKLMHVPHGRAPARGNRGAPAAAPRVPRGIISEGRSGRPSSASPEGNTTFAHRPAPRETHLSRL